MMERIRELYRLLRRAEREGDVDGAGALRWAIFTLEVAAGRERYHGDPLRIDPDTGEVIY